MTTSTPVQTVTLTNVAKELAQAIVACREATNSASRNRAKALWDMVVELPLPAIENVDQYANGTGYFDSLVNAKLEGTELYLSTSKSGRRVLVLSNYGKNIVVFERYTPGTNSAFVLISQAGCKNTANDPTAVLADLMEATASVWLMA